MKFIKNKFLCSENIHELDFQTEVVNQVGFNSFIIVAPTGSGKSIIALRICLNYLDVDENTKILYFTPTVVLTQQQYTLFKNNMIQNNVGLLTAQDKHRVNIFKSHRIIFSTPHIIANEVKKGNINLDSVKLIIFDEVHNIHNAYPYKDIIENISRNCRLVGLTASPGNLEEVKILKDLLFTENIIYAKPPRPEIIHQAIKIELPTKIKLISGKIVSLINLHLEILYKHNVATKDLFALRLKLLSERSIINFQILKIVNVLIGLKHLNYILTTQDIKMAKEYLKTKKWYVQIPELEEIKSEILNLDIKNMKLSCLLNLLTSLNLNNSKGIIFTQYRLIADEIYSYLNGSKIRAALLVGQKKGLKREEQVAVVRALNTGLINLVISTSVGEEGLDISDLDFVIVYSPINSTRRNIQRTGRTGRKKQGTVYYLLYKNTLDELYYNLSKNVLKSQWT